MKTFDQMWYDKIHSDIIKLGNIMQWPSFPHPVPILNNKIIPMTPTSNLWPRVLVRLLKLPVLIFQSNFPHLLESNRFCEYCIYYSLNFYILKYLCGPQPFCYYLVKIEKKNKQTTIFIKWSPICEFFSFFWGVGTNIVRLNLFIWLYFLNLTTLWDRYYYYSHFADVEAEHICVFK